MSKRISMIVTVALAFAAAVPAAFAGSGGGLPLNQQGRDWGNQVGQQQRVNAQTATPLSFDRLDPKKIGYLTEKQATTNAWLSRNFSRCDTDANAQVSRDEYAACTTKH